MLIEKITVFLFFFTCTVLFAQQQTGNIPVKPMTAAEMKSYEAMVGTPFLEPSEPRLKKETVVALLQEIHKTFVQAEVPESLQKYLEKGTSQLPSRNQILVAANHLKTMITDPELQEVTGYDIEWFRKIGTALVGLDGYHNRIMKAVNLQNEEAFNKYFYAYNLQVRQLNDFMQKPEKLKPAQYRKVKAANTSMRKKKYDLMERRYQYTVRQQENAEQNKNRRQGAVR